MSGRELERHVTGATKTGTNMPAQREETYARDTRRSSQAVIFRTIRIASTAAAA